MIEVALSTAGRGEHMSHVSVWRETLSGRVHSKCAGPEVETFLSCFRIVKAKVAVVEHTRGE